MAEDAPTAPPVYYTSKARLLAGEALQYCGQPRVLRACYCLGPGTALAVTIEELSGADILLQWAKHTFFLDVEDQDLMRTHFDQLHLIANRIPCFYLDYPRNFAEIPEVVEAVMKHATGLEN